MSLRRTPLVALPVVLAALVVGGCSSTVDGASLGQRIGTAISQQQDGRKVQVTCPEGIEDKKGVTFACPMTVGTPPSVQGAKVNVTLLGDSRFSYVVAAP